MIHVTTNFSEIRKTAFEFVIPVNLNVFPKYFSPFTSLGLVHSMASNRTSCLNAPSIASVGGGSRKSKEEISCIPIDIIYKTNSSI